VARKYQSVKGTRDLLPPETTTWAAVEDTARAVFSRFGYGEIRTPVLEETELFERSVGESTDIVGKEMYTFEDRKGRSLTLRPENTASVARAYLEHGLAEWPSPVKLYYIGPQFRYERPQKGRYRQFHQIGAELIGEASPLADAELLLMLVQFLAELGFEDLQVLLNSVGDEESREAYRTALLEYLKPFRNRLSEESRRRLTTNPLRILDSKAAADREILEDVPEFAESLSASSREHFASVQKALQACDISYRVEPRLVRGIDYYTETVFEIVSAGLGAQDAIVGGGRYDRLIADLGGGAVPGIGFAIGEDRLIEVLPEDSPARRDSVQPILVATAGSVGELAGLRLAHELRQAGIAAVSELTSRSLKTTMKRADRSDVEIVVLLGDEEMEAGEVSMRELATGEQRRLSRPELIRILEARS
jgi:histidyl-tRNA synthetase